MVKENRESQDLTKRDFLKLERSIHQLTTALTAHSEALFKHNGTIESLTRVIKQLEDTIKKEMQAESQPSLQLKETVTSFVEYHINPRYYQDSGYLRLNEASSSMDTIKRSP